MRGHKERAHALLSASKAHQWLNCTPSARLEEQFPDSTSEAAAEGTLAHELAEIKVRHYAYTTDFGKQKYTRALNKLKKQELWQNEMEGYTDAYLDYIKASALAMEAAPSVVIENRFDLGQYIREGFGTADCVLIGGGLVHVVDFKYGKGVRVDAEYNPQLMLYALGVYEAYKILYPIRRIRLAIVQPRISDEPSEWECTLEELLKFGEYVRGRAALAWEGKGAFAPREGTCRFCRARKQCRAWSDFNVKHAFDIGEMPPLITNEEVGKRLVELESVVKYQKDLQEYALTQCLAGKDIPGWKAVEGRGSRNWTDMEAAFAKLQEQQIPRALLYEERPLTLAQVEKAVGTKEFREMVGDMVVKKPGAPTLVKEADKRAAITNKVAAAEVFGNAVTEQ